MKYEEFLSVIAKGDITEEVMKEAKRLLKVQERKAKKDRERKEIEKYSFLMYSPYDD